MKQKPTHKTASLEKNPTNQLENPSSKFIFLKLCFDNYIFIQFLKRYVFFYKTAPLKSKLKSKTELVLLL